MVLVSSLFNHYEIFIKEDYKRKSSQYISMKDEEDDFDEQPTRQVSILCYFTKNSDRKKCLKMFVIDTKKFKNLRKKGVILSLRESCILSIVRLNCMIRCEVKCS